MTIIIPMAGKGERFAKRGYTSPKPLIEVSGVPMVVKAVQDLPKAAKHLFVVLADHLKKGGIDVAIKNVFPDARFISISNVTEGQACTCLLAIPCVENDEEVLIGACDNGIIYNPEDFEEAKLAADVLVFTFRNNVTVVGKPQQYGWVKTDHAGNAIAVSVKVPISNMPMGDHAVIGAFWFKRASIFSHAAEKMISERRRINNEFYVDECINDAIALGYRVKVFEVDKYVCWGTPDDYETYRYWQSFFSDKKLFS